MKTSENSMFWFAVPTLQEMFLATKKFEEDEFDEVTASQTKKVWRRLSKRRRLLKLN
jgi:hypothetical protein